jgi:hypothetical protein
MKRFLMANMFLLGTFVLWQGCSDNTTTGPDTQIVVPKYYTQYDTIPHLDSINVNVDTFTVKTTIDSSVIKKTITTIKPISDSCKNIIIKTDSTFDSISQDSATIYHKTIKKYIRSISLVDSFNTTTNTSHIDTLGILKIDTVSTDSMTVISRKVFRSFSKTTVVSKKQYFSAYLVASTSDYRTGNIGVGHISGDSVLVQYQNLMMIHPDNKIFAYNGSLYLLESFGADRIARFDGPVISPASVKYQVKIGTAVNLHDMAFVNSSKAYLTQYNDSMLVVLNLLSGAILGKVNLGKYGMISGDTVDVPYMDEMMVIGQKLYVLCQRLHSIAGVPTPTKLPGLIAVINTATDSVVDTISLALKNPVSLDTAGGYLYVSSVGKWFNTTDGGIEKVSLTTNTSSGVIVSESAFPGDMSQMVLVSPTRGYVEVSKSLGTRFWTEVVAFSPTTGVVGYTLNGIEDAFGGLLYDGIFLYIGDRSAKSPGVIVIDPADNRRIAGPLRFGAEPPVSLAILVTNKK